MYKPDFLLKNETHQILLNFDIKTDHQIPNTKAHLLWINMKKSNHLLDYTALLDQRLKIKKSEKMDEYLSFFKEIKINDET